MSLDSFMIAVSNIGSPESIAVLCVLLGIFLWVHKKPHHFFQFFVFISLCGISVEVLKFLFKVPRPLGGIIRETGYSFPSGHATMSTLFFLLLVYSYISHIKSRAGQLSFIIFGLACAGLISYSRIYLGAHTVTDVVGGICLGSFWFILSVLFYTHIDKKRAS